MTGSLGRRYARALLPLAREAGSLEEAGAELHVLARVFVEPRLAAIIENPTLGAAARRDLT